MTTSQDQNDRGARELGGALRLPNREASPDEDHQDYPGVGLLEERDRQRQEFGRELRELDREIEASNGYWLYNKIGLLEKSYFVFDVNYLNLKHTLEEFEQPMVFTKLWEEKNRDRFDLFMNDVIRLFHNYLSGAATLLDHVRTLQDDIEDAYRGTDFSDEYRSRWAQQFGESALLPFVEDLLAHMLHKGLPLALAELNFGTLGGGVEINSSIKLDASKLGEWDRWSAKGREYLNTLENKVKLDDIIKEHSAVVADFYQWFVTRQSEVYRNSIAELEELEEKRQDLEQKIKALEEGVETAEKATISVRDERDRLAKELEAERQYREWEKERATRLEAHLERELNKGFWSRIFGR